MKKYIITALSVCLVSCNYGSLGSGAILSDNAQLAPRPALQSIYESNAIDSYLGNLQKNFDATTGDTGSISLITQLMLNNGADALDKYGNIILSHLGEGENKNKIPKNNYDSVRIGITLTSVFVLFNLLYTFGAIDPDKQSSAYSDFSNQLHSYLSTLDQVQINSRRLKDYVADSIWQDNDQKLAQRTARVQDLSNQESVILSNVTYNGFSFNQVLDSLANGLTTQNQTSQIDWYTGNSSIIKVLNFIAANPQLSQMLVDYYNSNQDELELLAIELSGLEDAQAYPLLASQVAPQHTARAQTFSTLSLQPIPDYNLLSTMISGLATRVNNDIDSIYQNNTDLFTHLTRFSIDKTILFRDMSSSNLIYNFQPDYYLSIKQMLNLQKYLEQIRKIQLISVLLRYAMNVQAINVPQPIDDILFVDEDKLANETNALINANQNQTKANIRATHPQEIATLQQDSLRLIEQSMDLLNTASVNRLINQINIYNKLWESVNLPQFYGVNNLQESGLSQMFTNVFVTLAGASVVNESVLVNHQFNTADGGMISLDDLLAKGLWYWDGHYLSYPHFSAVANQLVLDLEHRYTQNLDICNKDESGNFQLAYYNDKIYCQAKYFNFNSRNFITNSQIDASTISDVNVGDVNVFLFVNDLRQMKLFTLDQAGAQSQSNDIASVAGFKITPIAISTNTYSTQTTPDYNGYNYKLSITPSSLELGKTYILFYTQESDIRFLKFTVDGNATSNLKVELKYFSDDFNSPTGNLLSCYHHVVNEVSGPPKVVNDTIFTTRSNGGLDLYKFYWKNNASCI